MAHPSPLSLTAMNKNCSFFGTSGLLGYKFVISAQKFGVTAILYGTHRMCDLIGIQVSGLKGTSPLQASVLDHVLFGGWSKLDVHWRTLNIFLKYNSMVEEWGNTFLVLKEKKTLFEYISCVEKWITSCAPQDLREHRRTGNRVCSTDCTVSVQKQANTTTFSKLVRGLPLWIILPSEWGYQTAWPLRMFATCSLFYTYNQGSA